MTQPDTPTPATGFTWKRLFKITAGAGALWITAEILLAIGIAAWFLYG